jgi:DNA-binding XRE family transcriptional regulator
MFKLSVSCTMCYFAKAQSKTVRARSMWWTCRVYLNLTQQDLAMKVGTIRAAISSIERAEKLMTASLLLRTATALEIKPETLLRIARL